MGARFWFGLIGGVIAAAIALLIVFAIVGWAIVAWGFLGALVAIGVIGLAFAWIYERRRAAL